MAFSKIAAAGAGTMGWQVAWQMAVHREYAALFLEQRRASRSASTATIPFTSATTPMRGKGR